MSTLAEWLLEQIDEDADENRSWARWSSPAMWAQSLAMCAAHRRIVEWHGADQHDCVGSGDGWAWPYVGCATLRALASAYADRPGYRQEWAV